MKVYYGYVEDAGDGSGIVRLFEEPMPRLDEIVAANKDLSWVLETFYANEDSPAFRIFVPVDMELKDITDLTLSEKFW